MTQRKEQQFAASGEFVVVVLGGGGVGEGGMDWGWKQD